MDFVSQVSEEELDLTALVSSMPCLWYILEVGLWQAVVSVVSQKASECHSITKLNSGLELRGGLVDQILDLHSFDGLTPLKELFW